MNHKSFISLQSNIQPKRQKEKKDFLAGTFSFFIVSFLSAFVSLLSRAFCVISWYVGDTFYGESFEETKCLRTLIVQAP